MVEWLRVSSPKSFFLWLCLLLVVLFPTLELRYSCLGESCLKLQVTQDTLHFCFVAIFCASKPVYLFPKRNVDPNSGSDRF